MEQNLARQARPRGYLAVAKPMAVGVAGMYRHLFVCSAVRGQLAVVRWPDFLTVWAGLEILAALIILGGRWVWA